MERCGNYLVSLEHKVSLLFKSYHGDQSITVEHMDKMKNRIELRERFGFQTGIDLIVGQNGWIRLEQIEWEAYPLTTLQFKMDIGEPYQNFLAELQGICPNAVVESLNYQYDVLLIPESDLAILKLAYMS